MTDSSDNSLGELLFEAQQQMHALQTELERVNGELASTKAELERLQDDLEAKNAVLFQIAFPKEYKINPIHGNPDHWPSTKAYKILGGVIEGGVRSNTLSELLERCDDITGEGRAKTALDGQKE